MKTEKVLSDIPDNPYILLTPGPLSTSAAVRNAMLRDWCTWDEDYNIGVVQDIRTRLTEYATSQPEKYETEAYHHPRQRQRNRGKQSADIFQHTRTFASLY